MFGKETWKLRAYRNGSIVYSLQCLAVTGMFRSYRMDKGVCVYILEGIGNEGFVYLWRESQDRKKGSWKYLSVFS